jgi:hypothetical protein
MIGAQTLLTIVDVHIVVSDKEIAFMALGAGGGKLSDAAFDGGSANLLGGSRVVAIGKNEHRQRYPEKKGERGAMASMRVTIHAKNLNGRRSWMLARGFPDV